MPVLRSKVDPVAAEPTPKHRLYLPDLAAGRQRLAPDRAHYLTRVLRLRTGDRFVGFDGRGRQRCARVAKVARDAVLIEAGAELAPLPESPLAIALIQSIARGERMDYALQKATELGVGMIKPVVTERTEVKLSGPRLERRLAHWRGVVIGACEQSGRTRLPRLEPPRPLNQCLAEPPEGGFGAAFVLTPQGARIGELPPPGPRVAVLIGPEGGLTEAEIALAGSAGFTALSLGPRILRCETAGPAAIAALQTLWGDLG